MIYRPTPISAWTEYRYDELGNQTQQIDALSRTTRYVHDNLGRRINRVLPLGQIEALGYDRVGNLATRQDFNGKTTAFQYDELNRLKFRIPDASFASPTIGFTYWPSGRRKTMSDASGLSSYFYDDRDRLQQKDTPQGTLAYTWDNQSNLQTMASESTALGTAVSYRYDELNRLQKVIDANVGTTTYGYDDVGNMQTVDAPNAVRHAYAYDPLNRLGTLTVSNLAGTIVQHSYTKAPTGHRRTHAEAWMQLPSAEAFTGSAAYTRTAAYAYDELWRLRNETISANVPAAPNIRVGSIGYDLDAVGNRRARTSSVSGIGNQSFAYDANDRLLSDTPDNNGNTLVGTVSASGGGDPLKTVAGTFTYDDRIDTAQTTFASTPAAIVYVYDGDGNKVSQTINGTATTHLVDTLNPTGYAQVIEERTNGTTTRAYVWGHMLIAQVIGPTRTFYGFDGHGNVRLITDGTGAVTDRYTYEAFGALIGTEGGTSNAHLYCGERFDPVLGQSYLRARTMNPLTGRFWTIDSWHGETREPLSLHKFLYAYSSPVSRFDPTGQFTSEFGELVHDFIEDVYDSEHPEALEGKVYHGKPTDSNMMGFKPDILNFHKKTYGDIKPFTPSGIADAGIVGLAYYLAFGAPSFFHFSAETWPEAPDRIRLGGVWVPGESRPSLFIYWNFGGIIFYTDSVQLAREASSLTSFAALTLLAAGPRASSSLGKELARYAATANNSNRAESDLTIARIEISVTTHGL